MRLTYIFTALVLVLRCISLVILAPAAVAIYFHDWNSVVPFLGASFLSLALSFIFRRKSGSFESLNDIKKSEALCIVALSWICFSLIGMLPYIHYGLNPLNALFESVSGITTTGATILTHFDYPKAMFFWRSMSQWLGGMGIIVLFIAVLPQFAVAGRQMFFAESPGASSTESKLTPRIRQTAGALWGIYFVLTIIEICVLKYLGMPLFDSICNSFSTLAGGGFSPAQNSIMDYGQAKFFWVIAIFMFLSGMNFALQYKLYIKRNFQALIKDDEFKLYFFVVIFYCNSLPCL